MVYGIEFTKFATLFQENRPFCSAKFGSSIPKYLVLSQFAGISDMPKWQSFWWCWCDDKLELRVSKCWDNPTLSILIWIQRQLRIRWNLLWLVTHSQHVSGFTGVEAQGSVTPLEIVHQRPPDVAPHISTLQPQTTVRTSGIHKTGDDTKSQHKTGANAQ